MATYDFTGMATYTIYSNGNYAGVRAGGYYVTKITDGSNTDNKFTTSDTNLTITISNGTNTTTDSGWKYLGTTTAIEGGPYIVVQKGTRTHVIETGPTRLANAPGDQKVAPATVANLNIDDNDFTVCFFPGTLIATPSGERRVEELVPGDPVLVENVSSLPATWIGRVSRKFSRRLIPGCAAVPVKWLGRQTVSTRFASAERLMPVRFAAGSLGGGGGNPFCRIAN